MSSTMVGPVEIIGSAAILCASAMTSVCAVSGAAIGATVGLPLYGAYKTGKFAYDTGSLIVHSRIASQEYEQQQKSDALAQRPLLLPQIQELLTECKEEIDLYRLLLSIEKTMSEDTKHADSFIVSATNETCENLLSNIRTELTQRKQQNLTVHAQNKRIQDFQKKLTQLKILPEMHFSCTHIDCASAEHSRATLLENALTTLIEQKKAEKPKQHLTLFEKLLRDAQKNIKNKEEALEVAKQSYIKLAFETELRNLHMVSLDVPQELTDSETGQQIRYFKSGSQKLKETTMADGTRVIELITPKNLPKQSLKVIRLQQKQRCKQYKILQENLKQNWEINWTPDIVTSDDCILHSQEASYFNTSHYSQKKEIANQKIHYQNNPED